MFGLRQDTSRRACCRTFCKVILWLQVARADLFPAAMENFSFTYMRQNFGKNSLKIFIVSDLGADGLSVLWVFNHLRILLFSHGVDTQTLIGSARSRYSERILNRRVSSRIQFPKDRSCDQFENARPARGWVRVDDARLQHCCDFMGRIRAGDWIGGRMR